MFSERFNDFTNVSLKATSRWCLFQAYAPVWPPHLIQIPVCKQFLLNGIFLVFPHSLHAHTADVYIYRCMSSLQPRGWCLAWADDRLSRRQQLSVWLGYSKHWYTSAIPWGPCLGHGSAEFTVTFNSRRFLPRCGVSSRQDSSHEMTLSQFTVWANTQK